MKKLLPIVTLLFVLVATPVIAHSKDPEENKSVTVEGGCDVGAAWKNHGQYVSCVAKTHPGGAAVSAAARSDVGKKTAEVSPSPSVSPSASPVASPEVSPSPSPEVSPSPSPSPTPSPSPEGLTLSTRASVSGDILEKIIQRLESLIDRLQDLL